MRFKILALTSVIIPFCLSVSARAETYTSLRESSPILNLNCANCQPLASKPDILMAQADWQEFSSEKGGFTVLMPGTPSEETRTDEIEDGRPYEQHYFTATQPEAVYLVTYSDFPGDDVNQVEPDIIIEAVIEGFLADGGELVSDREISLAGHPGREIEFKNSGGFSGNTQVFLVGKRIYQLVAITSNPDAPNRDDVQMFFDSFELMN